MLAFLFAHTYHMHLRTPIINENERKKVGVYVSTSNI